MLFTPKFCYFNAMEDQYPIPIHRLHLLRSLALPQDSSMAATLSLLILPIDGAIAVGGEFGILEGRTFALIHPIVMGAFFFYTLWAGYVGWQWQQVSTIQNEINEPKKQVEPTSVTPDGNPVEAPPSTVEVLC
ncbi:hypothetical protein K1719_032921 [Acacia pycnantha]|nr:hypothetical protein K1719_032921 [Acacia pycnantha]